MVEDPAGIAEDRLLRRLRAVAAAVILAMVVLIVVVDTVGKVAFGPSFHTSEVFLGTLMGALLLLLGIEAIRRLPGGVSR